MALEGLGSKIMIHKATEYAREASNMQRQAELMSQSAQKQMQNKVQQEATQVTDVYQPSEAVIQREKEKKDQKNREDEQELSAEQTEEKDMPPKPAKKRGYQKIDIRI